MKILTPSAASLSLVVALAQPGTAQTTAADLWAEWQAQAAAAGQTLTAEAVPTGDGLQLRNVVSQTEGDVLTTRSEIETLALTENANGTVSVSVASPYTATVTFPLGPGEPPGNVEFEISFENLNVTVSGSADPRIYSYTADAILLRENRLWGGDGQPPELDLDIEVNGLTSTYRIFGTDPETMRFTEATTIDGARLRLEAAPPGGEDGSFKAGVTATDLATTSAGSLISLMISQQIADTLPTAFDLDAQLSYGALNLEAAVEEGDDLVEVLYTNQGGTFASAFSQTELSYATTTRGVSARLTAPDLPIPLEATIGSTELDLAFPVSASDAPQDMAARIAVENFEPAAGSWALIDPTQAIPRGPASIILDLTGQVRVLSDLMTLDPDTITGPPAELRALSLNEMRLSAAGVEVTGGGNLTFAPGQLPPVPEGSIDLQARGVLALIDALIAGGMVPADQGAFARGALNIFARPGAEPDTFETNVQLGADGSVTANGIPLQ